MNKNYKEILKKYFKFFIILGLFSITCTQLFSVARYMNSESFENINLSITPPPKKLIVGTEFNIKLKETSSYEDGNNIITKVIFDYWNNGYIDEAIQVYTSADWEKGIPVDKDLKGSVRMFKSLDNTNIYILSESAIYANADASMMFYNLNGVKEIRFNNLNVSNVENMYRMFGLCSNLEILNLSSFDTLNATNMRQLFTQDAKLKTIYVSEKWNIEKVNHSDIIKEDEPFLGCLSLVGENGTLYNEESINISFAQIDKQDNKGYFTYKPEGDNTIQFMNTSNSKENVVIENENIDQNNTKIENKIEITNTNTDNNTQNTNTNIENKIEKYENNVMLENKINENTNTIVENTAKEDENLIENKIVIEENVDVNNSEKEENIDEEEQKIQNESFEEKDIENVT